jgi:esterase
MTANLYHSVAGDGQPVILMHGLFGSGSNLGALARHLQDGYRVYSLDLPNHGRSDWVGQTDIRSLSGHVRRWLDSQQLEDVRLIGHSLGGKVAMQLALDQPDRVAALVVADIAPVAYGPHHDDVFAALDEVEQASCRSRSEAQPLMAKHLPEEMVVQFLLKSLKRDEDGVFRWRFNLQGIKDGYGAVREAITAPAVFERPVLFIKGADSDYILPQHRDAIMGLFPSAGVKVMPDCGHWLHAQQPRLFNGIVSRFLS